MSSAISTGHLMVEECTACGTRSLIRRGYCCACHRTETEVRKIDGAGRITAIVNVPEGRDGPAFVVGLVSTPDRLTVMARLPQNASIGDTVQMNQTEVEGSVAVTDIVAHATR